MIGGMRLKNWKEMKRNRVDKKILVYEVSPPDVGDTSLSAVTIVWNYVGELVFNLLVLVGAVKAADRIVREMMGL